MGEQLELLAMKAAGVSLMRIMRPVLLVAAIITGVSFHFQNNTSPKAQVNMRTLLLSMKQTQPAVEIPEGIFYNNVPNMNIYVQRKTPETGMLYQVIIYKTDQGFENAQIVLADSGKLEITEDKLHLKVSLWNGNLYQKPPFKPGTGLTGVTHPYLRQPFHHKQFLYDFDSNFNMADEELMRNMPSTKSMAKIETDIDSMMQISDSLGKRNYVATEARWYSSAILTKKDSTTLAQAISKAKKKDFDHRYKSMSQEEQDKVKQAMKVSIASQTLDWEGMSFMTKENNKMIRRHWVEWHQKMALSLACLLFFFIGAPLGAIIRKGGLGLPTVISVAIFIFYYIINTSGMKMARDGAWDMVYGMWISSAILLPIGIFFTYKANKDSILFNSEAYKQFMRTIFGIRVSRNITRKEVIIDDPDYEAMRIASLQLSEACAEYIELKKLYRAPNYLNVFFRYQEDHHAEDISKQLEAMVEVLSNSTDTRILACLNQLPTLLTRAHLSPFHSSRWNKVTGILFPIGLLLWWRIWSFRRRLNKDMKQIIKVCEKMRHSLEKLSGYVPKTETTEDKVDDNPTLIQDTDTEE
jgi:lipopolysaccharide export system permease protein